MAVSQADIKEQLPYGAQIASGNTGKEVAGVIDETLHTESDVLAHQARTIARAKGLNRYEDPANFSPEFLQNVRKLNMPRADVTRSLSEDTINSLLGGDINRDQTYNGNNANWTGYYLEPLAKFVVPFDTPFRNMLPRTKGVGIDAINWRAIVDVFGGNGPAISNFILAQQSSPQKAQYTWANKSNLLRQLAFQDIVTFESELFGQMFEPDVRAKVAAKLAPSLMVGQEMWYLNAAQQLWSPAPANGVSTATSGGTVTAATYWIIVTAVNAQGESLAWSYAPSTVAAPQAASITTTGSTSTISFNINRVPGATSYNVYMGTGSTQPANSAMWKQSATTQFGNANSLNDPGGYSAGYFTVTCSAPIATSGTAYSSIISSNAPATIPYQVAPGSSPSNYILTFDGIQSLIYNNAAYNGASINTAGTGGESAILRRVADAGGALAKSDIDNWLEAMYLNGRANPEALLVGIKDHKALTNIVMNATNYRVTSQNGSGLSDLFGGGRATKWINQTTGRVMDIIMCPYLTQGSILAVSLTLPFSVAEIDKAPLRIEYNRDMWAVEYAPDQSHMTQYSYAAYTSETMVSQYLAGQGILTGIVTA
jgi:hypothetical protein